jgi:hypothetical protein
MANVIKMLRRCPFMQTINIFQKTLRFFTISFHQATDVYVKIYETAKLTVRFMFSKLKKQISTLALKMYCGLHFQFDRAHGHL